MTDIPVVTIDTGVPVPEATHNNWPIRALKVGESFLFPLDKRPSIQSAASRIKSETGYEYTVKKMDETNARIWRSK